MRRDIISIRVATLKKKIISSVNEVVAKLEPSCTVFGYVKFSCNRKQYGVFFKILKIELPYDPAISLLSVYPKELKAGIQRDTCSQQRYSQLPNGERNPSIHGLMNE